MRDLLHEPESEEDDYSAYPQPYECTMPKYLGTSAGLMGFRSLCHSLREFHPSLRHSVALFEVFKENVAPIVTIFHMPSLINMFWDAVVSLDTLDKDTEALIFAIYYSAAVSLEPDNCFRVLGEVQSKTLDILRFSVEQAFARADFLNTQSMVLLQAAVLFLSALRREDDSRTVWSLTALVFHIAQAMGLHHDGTVFGLKPFETELRRRLWWHICLLDNRSSSYHGCEPIVQESSFDTRLPLNINDNDLDRNMTEPPAERVGATDMVFCVIRCEALQALWKIAYIPPNMRTQKQPRDNDGLLRLQTDREVLVRELQERLENRYLNHIDLSVPFLRLAATVTRMIMARLLLTIHESAEMPQDVRDRVFDTTVETMNACTSMSQDECMSKWAWHSKTHVNWHVVAFVLSEVCVRPASPQCELGWQSIVQLERVWQMARKKGTVARSIKRLMAKAQYVREVQSSLAMLPPNGQSLDACASVFPEMILSGAIGNGDSTRATLVQGAEPLNPLQPEVDPLLTGNDGALDMQNAIMLNQDNVGDYRIQDWLNIDNTEEMSSVMKISSV